MRCSSILLIIRTFSLCVRACAPWRNLYDECVKNDVNDIVAELEGEVCLS